MRILHVISGLDPSHGGPTMMLLGLTRAQTAAGLNVTVAATWRNRSGFDVAAQMESHGVCVRMIGPAHDPMSRYRGLAAIMREMIGNADVVHIHAMWESIQHTTARICQAQKKPYIITPHGMLSPWNLSRGRISKRLYLALRARRNLNRAAFIHYTTQEECDLARPLKLKAQPLVETLGIDLAEFDPLPPRGAFRAAFPSLGTRPMVLFLSRLNYKKGLDLLIPAFARANLNPATMLVLAGPDPDGYQVEVERMVRENHISGQVVFTGMLAGPRRIEAMVDADLFVLPSYQENFGIAVVEALAAGCPVLISDQVNIHAQITNAKIGGVVPASLGPLTKALQQWMSDSSLRTAAAAQARDFALRNFDWNPIARRWVEHYRGTGVRP